MELVFDATPAGLALIAGAVLSLLFSYVPGLNAWYAGLLPEVKRLAMAALMLLVAGVVFGLACAGLLSGVTCTQAGAFELLITWAAALVGNQTAYMISPATQAVKTAKKQRAAG